MLLPTAFNFFLALVAAAPSAKKVSAPSSVKIKGISLLGTGCPAGSTDAQIDATGSVFEATFSAYEVQSGPKASPSDRRKNCKLTVNMDFESGYQFRIIETDIVGYAEIPAGVNGQCINTFSFAGNDANHVDYAVNLAGQHRGRFELQSQSGLSSWSPCGRRAAILNLNTSCNISPTNKPALIAVDHMSGKLKVKCAIEWRRCPGN